MISVGSGKGRMARRSSSFSEEASSMIIEVKADRLAAADLSIY